MIQIVDWRVTWDVNDRVGRVELDPFGPAPAFPIQPLSAEEFTAICQALLVAKSLGRTPTWDNQTKQLIA